MVSLFGRPLCCFKNLAGKSDLPLHSSIHDHLGNEAREKEILVRMQLAQHPIGSQLSTANIFGAALHSTADSVRHRVIDYLEQWFLTGVQRSCEQIWIQSCRSDQKAAGYPVLAKVASNTLVAFLTTSRFSPHYLMSRTRRETASAASTTNYGCAWQE